tara:strand:+ start:13623 stop:13835 length:213 start_codon:yes stop_codon:yes gene_type:complete
MHPFLIYIGLGVLLNLLVDLLVNFLIKHNYTTEEESRWNFWLKCIVTLVWPVVFVTLIILFVIEMLKLKR